MNCGQPARNSTAADDARLARLAAGAPTPLVNKVRAADRLSGERRLVTILFVDVVGSTELAERMDVEAWTSIMNRALDRFTPIIYRYEGTIAQLLGDALWAFFGAPVTHEDDPVRAVHAALDIMEAAGALAAQVRREYALDFAIRACLNTGSVVVGPVGTDLRYTYTATGDAVNLASRLKFAARPMTTLVSESTYRFVATAFDCSDLGPIEVKGRSGPVRVYQVLGRRAEPGRRAGPARSERMMVNRGPELGTLTQLAGTVQAGLGRAVLVVGESGIGKTRLISEWKATTEARGDSGRPVKWAEGGCLSYGHDLAYHLLTDLLRSLLGIPRTADESQARPKLLVGVTELFGPLPMEAGGAWADSPEQVTGLEVYPYLGHLLNVELEGESLERVRQLDPQAIQAQYVAAMRHLLRALAARGPVVVILEDLQWADPSSVEVLVRLLPLAAAGPLLFCLVIRPEPDAPGWRLVTAARDTVGAGLTELRLGALTEAESIQLASSVLEVDALPQPIRTLTLSKAEGNPLFVEELLQTLIDRGAIVPDNGGWVPVEKIGSVQIPDSLQGLLLARIDRLSDDAKNTLRVASVIGRQFPVKVLEQVLGGGERRAELLGLLSALESANLVRLSQSELDLECCFRHGLVQEAAYASLLKSDRQRLHLAVGEALERTYPDRLGSCELAPKLSEHFSEAGDTQRALRYHAMAGDAALACYANSEAESYFRAGLELAPVPSERAPLLAGLGEALYWQSRFEGAIETWQESVSLYQEIGPEGSDRVAWLYGRSARAAWAGGDTPRGLRLCQEGLKAVASAPESPGMALLTHEAARAYLFNGLPDQARPLGFQALAIAERLGAVDVQADALATLGLLHVQSSNEAIELLQRAVELAESAGLLSQAARAHVNLAATLAGYGDARGALDHYRSAAELHRQRGDMAGQLLGLSGVTESLLGLAEFAQVESTFSTMSRLLAQVTDPSPAEFLFRLSQVVLLRFRGELAPAAKLLRTLLADARQRDDLYIVIEANSQLGDILIESLLLADLASPGESLGAVERRMEEAEAALSEAIWIADQWRLSRVWSRCLLSSVYVCQGQLEQARCLLDETRETAVGPRLTLDEGWLSLAEARVAVAQKQWPEAIAAFEKAAGTFARLGMPWWRARVLYDWAEANVTRGEPTDLERARTLLREAAELFDEMGVERYAEVVQARQKTLRAMIYTQAQAHQQVAQELAMAWRIQEGLLPASLPSVPGWQLAAILEPAKETSGDFYDFIPLPNGMWGIVVADVAEKGAGAALYMALSRTLIRTYAAEYLAQPELALAAVNSRILSETQSDMFVTVVYAILNPVTGSLIYCNAGHNPPFLLRGQESGAVEALRRTGMPLGIPADGILEQGAVHLNPGDALVLYTDGVTEAQNAGEQLFGEERLLEVAQASLGRSAPEMQTALLGEVRKFVGRAPQFDDLTLVVLVRELTENPLPYLPTE
jgi:serine phosphatase RsbU (regulator of sigma subunit)/class 3 adenylate cyclase